jgi:hypothetical protein
VLVCEGCKNFLGFYSSHLYALKSSTKPFAQTISCGMIVSHGTQIFHFVRDKISGTDWSIVTTSDGKKYYYDNKQKVCS